MKIYIEESLAKKGKLVKWSGGFSQLTLNITGQDSKTVFIPTHDVTLNYPELILNSDRPQDLKWWGTFKQEIDSWFKERSGNYTQEIEIRGTGYKFEIESQLLTIDLGKSHEFIYDVPSSIEFIKNKGDTKFLIGKSADKKVLTQYLANIKKLFPLNAKQHGIVLGKLNYNIHNET